MIYFKNFVSPQRVRGADPLSIKNRKVETSLGACLSCITSGMDTCPDVLKPVRGIDQGFKSDEQYHTAFRAVIGANVHLYPLASPLGR